MEYDVAIVGAGSAGCVLAARLTEDPRRSVILLEAGPDYPSEADLPPEIRAGFNPTPSHDWGYTSEPGAGIPPIPLWRGKLVGGCSATNAAIALRGAPADYDVWAAEGNPGWAFADVLPCFRKLETDLDFHDDWHGRDGPLPIRRYPNDSLTMGQAEFLAACAALGFPAVADHNAPGAVGAGRVPVNSIAGVRKSTALTYLASARGRPNLTIRSASQILVGADAGADTSIVDKVLFEGRVAKAVRVAQGNETIHARRIILSAGAFGSPAILLRSGIGPAADLMPLGIEVLEDLPGVGRNLADHPRLGLRFATPRPATADEVPGCQVLLTMKSSASSMAPDLQIFPWALSQAGPEESPTGGLTTIHVAVMKPKSRGRLRLRSANPADPPLIDPGYFTHPDDMPRMLLAVRTARQLARTAPLSAVALHELSPGPAVTSLDVTSLDVTSLDVTSPDVTSPDVTSPDVTDPEELAAAIRAELGTYFHPVGTCRMGQTDPMAVVNSRGSVHGIDGLSVVDASIMPEIPSSNTNLPTIMLAERCAAWLLEDL